MINYAKILSATLLYLAGIKQFYDPGPLDRLIKDGFIKELYPR